MEGFLTRPSRLSFTWVSLGRSRRSSNHIARRLVNSLGTLSRFRLVRGLFRRSSGILGVGLRTGSRIGIEFRGMLVPGRFGRRSYNRGFAWVRDLQRSRKTREDPECSSETDGESVGILCLNSRCFWFCSNGRKDLIVGETLVLVG